MANVYDQFDRPGGGNVYDQFDESLAGAKPSATDYLKGIASGVGGLVSGVGYLAERAGADEIGGNLRLAGGTAQKAFLQSMTPAGQRAAQSQVFEDDPGSALPKLGDHWGQALAMGAAQSAPSMLAAAIPGGVAAAGIRGAAGIAASRGIGGALAPLAAGTAAPVGGWATNFAGNLAARAPAALGFGAAEGAVAGASNAAQWKSDIEQKPLAELRNMPGFAALEAQIGEQAARQQIAEQGAADIMARTTLSTGGIGALTGGGALGSAFQRVTTGAKGGILGAIGRDAAKEAAQEIPQSGGERTIQNIATRDYLDPSQSIAQGVLADALSGGAIGGVMGGVTGGGSHLAKGPLQKAAEASAATTPPTTPLPDTQTAGIPAGNAGNPAGNAQPATDGPGAGAAAARADASVLDVARAAAEDFEAAAHTTSEGFRQTAEGLRKLPQQPNTPAAPGIPPAPVSTAAPSIPTNQAEPAGVPISQPQEGTVPRGNETEITKPAAPRQQAQPAAVSGAAGTVGNTGTPNGIPAPNTGTQPAPAPTGQDVNLQNRDRSRAASVIQMSEIARNPDYMRLGPSRTPDSGAPMVFAVGDDLSRIPATNFGNGDVAVMSDGQRVPFRYAVVDASQVEPSNFADGRVNPAFAAGQAGTIKALNNGRTAGLRAAYELGSAGTYQTELAKDLANVGISPGALQATPNPILVRVYSDTANTAGMAAKSQAQGLGMSPAELARQDAPLLDSSVLELFRPGDDVAAADNRDFVRAFVGRLQQSGQDIAGMMTDAGTLSSMGRQRIQAALMQAAYGDADLVAELFDSIDTDIKAIGEALKAVAGAWANMRDSARLGAIAPEVDITDSIVAAVRLIQKARRDRASLLELVSQVDIESGAAADERTVAALRLFYSGQYLTRAVGKESLITDLMRYIRLAMATAPGSDMFGEIADPGKLLQSITSTRDKPNEGQQGSLLGAPPAGSGAGGKRPETPGQGSSGGGSAPAPVGGKGESKGQGDQDAVILPRPAHEAEAEPKPAPAAKQETPASEPLSNARELPEPAAKVEPLENPEELPPEANAASDDLGALFDSELEAAFSKPKEEGNEPGSVRNPQRDRQAADAQRGDAGALSDERGREGAAPGGGVPVPDANRRRGRPGGPGVSGVGAASGGERGDQPVPGAERPAGVEKLPAGDNQRQGSAAVRPGGVAASGGESAAAVGGPAGGAVGPRSASAAGKSAAKNAGLALSDVAKGLNALFKPKPGQLGTGLPFDEDTYAAAKPYFQAGLEHFRQAGADIVEMMRALIAALRDQFGMDKDTIAAMKPYVLRYISDVQAGREAIEETNPQQPAKDKLQQQQAAESIEVIVGDKANIDATLPFLTEGQREDVLFAEKRWAAPDGYGVLFTNGTGTGKTFLALGAIKRLTKRGKGNGIIVVPNEAVMNEWVKSAPALGLQIKPLTDTQDAGSGIAITTYANFGQNDEIAKRDYDFVAIDEAHLLMLGKDAEPTKALDALRAVSLHPDGVLQRAEMQNRELVDRISTTSDQLKSLYRMMNNPDIMDQMYAAYRAEADGLEKQLAADQAKWKAVLDAVESDVMARQGEKRTRAIFLSATPFAYEPSIQWGEGYLYEFPKVSGRGYNAPNGYQKFMMQHFGWRMRNGKLNKPPAEVDSDLMQRQFNTWLRKEGVLSARMLDVDFDYERKFILIQGGVGQTIDDGLRWLRETDNGRYWSLYGAINEQFDYLTRSRLLEAIKARAAIPYIKKHHALGRKVVVFYDFNSGGGINVFNLSEQLKRAEAAEKAPDYSVDKDGVDVPVRGQGKAAYGQIKREKVPRSQLIREFMAARPELQAIDFSQYGSPLTTLLEAFPGAGVYNGMSQYKKTRVQSIRDFNDDAKPEANLLLVQKAANAGWSGHDTTGKHGRVLINLGLPVAPIEAIQEEGRIYRVGQKSDANFQYFNTGTNWERYAFGSKIARRAGTAENLAMGEQARGLREAFIQAFENSDPDYEPGAADGRGGKAGDRDLVGAITEWDRARSLYFAQQKKTSRTKAAEGVDYYATPEPLGLKMVEWAGILTGESVLEPSAGHGAIARWFPEKSDRTVIEPSLELASRLTLATDAKLINERFEGHDTINKYDAIVMNPPFGTGGKTAIEHLDKAFRHLTDGGRVVALIQEGSAANKRFDDWLYGDKPVKAKPVANDVGAFGAVFLGDTVTVEVSGMAGIAGGVLGAGTVTGKVTGFREGKLFVKREGEAWATGYRADQIRAVQPTGARTTTVKSAPNAYLRASIGLPGVTFERAGTGVKTRVVIIDKIEGMRASRAVETQPEREIEAASVKDLFDRLENMEVVGRSLPAHKEQEKKQGQDRDAAKAATSGKADDVGLVQPEGSPATIEQLQKPEKAGGKTKLLTDAPRVKHVVASSGKELFGVIAMRLTRNEAKSVDPYSWPKDGGFFIRMEHVVRPASVAEQERAVYNVHEPDGITGDLFRGTTPDLFAGTDHALPAAARTNLHRERATPERAARPAPRPVARVLAVRQAPDAPGLYHVSTQLVTVGERELPVERIRTTEDAAKAFAYLPRFAVEHYDAIVTDKDGKPLAIIGGFKGDVGSTTAPPSTLIAELSRIDGASKLWTAHNHPSGLAALSEADVRLDKNLQNALDGSGIEYHGLFAMVGAGTRTGVVKYDHTMVGQGEVRRSRQPLVRVPIVDRELTDRRDEVEKIDSPEKAKSVIQQIAGDSAGLVFLDSQNGVAAFAPFSADEMGSLRVQGRLMRLFRAASKANARSAIMADPGGKLSPGQARNLRTAMVNLDIGLLDVITYASRGGEGPARSWMSGMEGLPGTNPGNVVFSAASAGTAASPADRAVFNMARDGKPAGEILSFIAKSSRRPFNRVLASALRRAGLVSTVTLDSASRFGQQQGAQRYAAAYNSRTDTVALFTHREAERHVLHEFVHAATMKAIKANGLSAVRMRALFKHVQQSGMADGQYGMSNLDEFIAEVFTKPEFQALLKTIPAPKSSALKSAWEWFVRIVARIVGIKTKPSETALDRALVLGAQLMQENVGLRGQDGQTRFSQSRPFDGRETAAMPLKPGTKTLMVDGTERPALNSDGKPIHWSEEGVRNFWRWFQNSDVTDDQGRPLVLFHGASADFGENGAPVAFDFGRTADEDLSSGKGAYLTTSPEAASKYANGISWGNGGQASAPNVMPVYARIEFPFSKSATYRMADFESGLPSRVIEDAKESAAPSDSFLEETRQIIDDLQFRLEDLRRGYMNDEVADEYRIYEDDYESDDEYQAAIEEAVAREIGDAERSIERYEGEIERSWAAAKESYAKERLSGAEIWDAIKKDLPEFADWKNERQLIGGDSASIEMDTEVARILFDAFGFDGVKRTDKFPINEAHTVYIANNSPAQVKSAVGNAGAFSPDDPDIRFSLDTNQDVKYADLERQAKNGDSLAESKAQRMVDDAAKQSGYTVEAFHGRRGEWGFTVFDTGKEGGAHFGTLAQAEMRGGKGTAMRFYLKMEDTARMRDTGQFRRIPLGRDSAVYLNRYEGISLETVKSIPGDALDRMTDAQFRRAVPEADDSYVVRKAWQIKSAAPFTYRNDGTLIPLSDRFDSGNDDIRFSAARDGDLDYTGENGLFTKPAAAQAIDRTRLRTLRSLAADLERPRDGIFLFVTEDGRAVATGPKGARIPEAFRRFARDNGLTFHAQRKGYANPKDKPVAVQYGGISGASEPMPWLYRSGGAQYFGEMGEPGLDRTDDIRFNIAENWHQSQIAQEVAKSFKAAARSDEKLSWLNPVQTQYHKAGRLAQQGKFGFKRVFDLGQKFLTDISRFAVMAENSAPTLFHQIRSGADVKQVIGAALRGDFGKQHNADIKAIASPLYEGTLYGGGNPMAGMVWTDEQLRSRFGLTDRQIKLYHEAREAVQVSMDEMAKSLIAKHAKRERVTVDPSGRLQDVAETVRDSLNLRADVLAEEAQSDHDDTMQQVEDLREAGGQDRRANDMESEAKAKLESQQAEVARIKATVADVQAIADKAQNLQDAGYFPLMRFGRHTVTAKDENGKVRHFSMHDGIPLVPRSGQAQANRLADALREDHPEWTVTTGLMNPEMYKLYQGMNVDALQLFADHLDEDTKRTYQEVIRLATNERSALKRMLKREGTPGFDRDVRRTLASFILSNARYTSSAYNLSDMAKAAEDANEDGGDIGAEAVNLYKYVAEPQEEAAKIRGFLFFNFLGGSLAAAMVNATQVPMMTFPRLAQHEQAGKLAARLGRAAKLAVRNPADIDGDIGAALRRAEEDGITAPHQIYEMTATAANNIFTGSRAGSAILRAWGAPFALAEAFNRRTTFIAAYQIGQGMTANQLRDAGAANAFEFAEKIVSETQGIYNRGNRVNLGRGAIGATVMTFKQFSIMYLEMFSRLPARQKAIMAGMLILAAGAGGLPFAEDIEDIVDTIGQWLGYRTNTRRTIRRGLTDLAGQRAADIAMNGVLSQMGVDLHSRLGLQNILPGSAIMKPSTTDKSREFQDLLGPAASVVASLGQALQDLATGRPLKAAEALAPVAVQNAVKGARMVATGRAEDMRGKPTIPVSAAEAAAKGVGFNPKAVADYGTAKRDIMQDERLLDVTRERFTAAIVDAIISGDDEARREALQQVVEWNRRNPDARININPASIRKRVSDMRAEGPARVLKSLSPSLRQQAQQEFADAR